MRMLKEEWKVRINNFDSDDWGNMVFKIIMGIGLCLAVSGFIYSCSKMPARLDYECYAGYMFTNPWQKNQTPIQIFGEDGKPLKCPAQEPN